MRSDVRGGIADRVRRVMALKGVEGIQVTGVTVHSAETVERDYAGNWFYALR